jgi:uncharacterized membrane protein
MLNQVRYQLLDCWRGSAIGLMILYHLCFDLNHFQILDLDFYHHPFWLDARIIIVSLFLLLVGISLELSARRGLNSRVFQLAYGKRLVWLLICALLVSLSSYWLSPSRWIFFGILHFIFVASLLGLMFVGRPKISLGLGILIIWIGVWWTSPQFDQPAWQWFGLMTYKPQTNDYVPFMPWFGVVLLGQSLGAHWFGGTIPVLFTRYYGNSAALSLSWAGRHSLLIYMLHQPLLFGILALITGQL